jgi:hypothetical protein
MNAIGIWTAALAVVGLVAIVRKPELPPLFAIAAIAAMAAHAGLLLTATLAAGFSRFLQGLWPAIVLASAFGAYWALMLARPLRKTNF